MWEVIASVAVAMSSCYWGGAIMMSPMIFAAHEHGSDWKDQIGIAVLFTYPAALFGLLHLADMEFFGSDPLAWAKVVLSVGAVMIGINIYAAIHARGSSSV